jgi:hypothetical protein
MSDELPQTVSQICSRLPGARGAWRVSPATVTRWISVGCPARDGRCVRLAATRCGGRWLVFQSDLEAFFAALGAEPAISLRTRTQHARNPTRVEGRFERPESND